MQHDQVISNQTFPATRADINAALAAAFSSSSGAAAPTTTIAGQLWYDTTANVLRMRNSANSAWITLFTIVGGQAEFAGRSAAVNGSPGNPSIGFASDIDSGIYLPAANVVAGSAGGVKAFQWTNSAVEAFVELIGRKITSLEQFYAPGNDGVTRPGYSWSGDINKGIYSAGASAIGVSINGTRRMYIANDQVTLAAQLRAIGGSQSAPGMSFDGKTGTGWYLDGDNHLCCAVNGNKLIEFGSGVAVGAFSGNGAGLTELNSAAVRDVIAAAAEGSLGTYAFLRRASGTGGINFGEVIAGPNLRPSNSASQAGGTVPSGSWKCLGSIQDGTASATVFVRV